MPRIARQREDDAVYHVMVRGNNREQIFYNDDDKVRYLETLKRYLVKFDFKIHAYCLMPNHAHLLLNCNGQDISKIMQGINLSYTLYINHSYDRCGHLFQGRFKSVIIKKDKDIIQESRYIHFNPVKANLVVKAIDHKWSSYGIYMGKKDVFGLVDEDIVLQCFNHEKSRARELYAEYVDKTPIDITSEIEKDVYVSSDIKPVFKRINEDEILSKVAENYNICVDDIVLRCNKRFSRIKQIAIYLISLKSQLAYKEIGQKFNICGSAVAHNIRKAIDWVIANRETAYKLNLLFR
jgi:putative transposase